MPKQKVAPKWYPTEDPPKGKALTKTLKKDAKPKLRGSITPGTVLILLAGRFKGKRVVFLKQLESGLLLVTGPFKVNGVPLRRVNQAYVIATSTKIDVTDVDTSGISDVPDKKTKRHFFSKVVPETKEEGEGEFVSQEAKKPGLTEERKAMQAKVDAAVITAVEKTSMMKDYLKSRFSLEKGQYPHLMKF
mmetsp:Transcript_9632/g.23716  ORF Transcript_9632/g.23716 Transcript_9632/m.23716 type:complete len:190 (-) Transcript_9632:264-833(-)|eukprot:CAMPEP_0114505126 /NCGR_PEP_ID=MMETSP0109-20121206/10675_1 /TAXON_ID=29199 /ORGANISM="Chlorarachnion reptans, Strain CCCM449" /LENGTH=189 /DNA_ID=CAMNT_0001683521 /DNA_START=71 /DNA_END=640 /DNA_ORIENTATION=+